MKTINMLVKDFIRGWKSRINREKKPDLLTSKTIKDETESDENSGNPQLDYSDAREDPADHQKAEPTGASPAKEGGSDSNTGDSGGDPFRDSGGDRNARPIVNESPEEAYMRGLKDGRNQQIEEKYFPNVDDGIPHFRGRPSRAILAGDFFTMAREA